MNTIDCLVFFGKHFYKSIVQNIDGTHNILLGKSGISHHNRFQLYDDNRHIAVRIVFGILTFPIVFLVSGLINTFDLVFTFFRNWDKTIKEPATIVFGIATILVTAIPVLLLRKAGKGFFVNMISRPLQDKKEGKPFNARRFIKGFLTAITLGIFSILYKTYKASTGRTKRFGSVRDNLDYIAEGETQEFAEDQFKFKEGLDKAAKGKFPEVNDEKGPFSPMMRLFYRMRHPVEKVIKADHDAYLAYERKKTEDAPGSPARNMQGFFKSAEYQKVKEKMQRELRRDDRELIDKVEMFLSPPPPAA